MSYDLLTFGEAMLRLTAPPLLRLEQTRKLDVSVACTELTVAALLVRMGCSAAFVTRLANTALGRIINADARAQGVDTSWVHWTDDERTGLMFYEIGVDARPGKVIYDRNPSTAARMCIDDAPWCDLIDRSRRVHISCITASLSPSCEELSAFVAENAKRRGKPLSLDLNFRASLMTPESTRRILARLAPNAEVLFVAERDAQTVLGMSGAGSVLARSIAERYGIATVVLTLPPNQAQSFIVLASGREFAGKPINVAALDRLGVGDSLCASILFGLLQGDLAQGVRIATRAIASALTTLGDFNYIDPEELHSEGASVAGGVVR